MNGQSFLLLAIGFFVALIVTVATVDQYLFDEHPPSEVSGLIWLANNVLARATDFEAVLEITEEAQPGLTLRMMVRLLTGPPVALSVRYLNPSAVQGELITVQNDLMSHYFPSEEMIVTKRWVGVPLAAVGLAALDLTQLEKDWKDGKIRLQVLQNAPSFITNPLPAALSLDQTLVEEICLTPYSFCLTNDELAPPDLGFSNILASMGNPIQGEYILEVRDAVSDDLTRMVWINRDSYKIEKVVYFEEGRRSRTILLERMEIDKGLTTEDVLTMPRGVPQLRG